MSLLPLDPSLSDWEHWPNDTTSWFTAGDGAVTRTPAQIDGPMPTLPGRIPEQPSKITRHGTHRSVKMSGRLTTQETDTMLAMTKHPDMPVNRGDCAGGPRPCPMVRCKFNIAIDVPMSADNTTVTMIMPDTAIEDMTTSCVLDIADRGGVTEHEVARVLGVSRQYVHMVTHRALRRAKSNAVTLGLSAVLLAEAP